MEFQNLSEAFAAYLRHTFCEENYLFWTDADEFRRMYGAPPAGPDPTVSLKSTDEYIKYESSLPIVSDNLIVPHAFAIIQRYLGSHSTYEVNAPSMIVKQLEIDVEDIPKCYLLNKETLNVQGPVNPKILSVCDNPPPMKVPISPTTFDKIQTHLFRLMCNDSIPKFIKTEIYQTIFWKLVSKGKIIPRDRIPTQVLNFRPSVSRSQSFNFGIDGARTPLESDVERGCTDLSMKGKNYMVANEKTGKYGGNLTPKLVSSACISSENIVVEVGPKRINIDIK